MKVPAYEVNLNTRRLLGSIAEVLDSGWVTQGPVVEELETAWEEITGQPYAVAVSSGQHALEIALGTLRWPGKPQVVVQANAFHGDVAAVLRCGAMPVFVDVDESMQIDVDAVRALADLEIAGVLAVHIGGWISERMDELLQICLEREWFLVEDACHAHGSRREVQHAGSWGDAAAFSFYATKVVTCGEGGMLVTSRPGLASFATRLRNNGRASVFDPEPRILAGDCRLSDILAAVALHQTRALPSLISERAVYARLYDQALEGCEHARPLTVPGCQPNYYKYIVLLDGLDPEVVTAQLEEEGVSCSGPVYERPACALALFRQYVDPGPVFPRAERQCRSHICLPMFNGLGQERALHVQRAIQKVLGAG